MVWWTGAAILAAGYVGGSIILFKWPTLLHKKKNNIKFRAAHISHRGGAGENIENTMTAFRHAVDDCGTDMLELDCQLTADGQVIVAHDPHLLRICGVDKCISDVDYEKLPPILPSLPLDFNREFVCRSQDKDRKFPLLKDVFDAFPKVPINIDVKQHNHELMAKIADLVTEYKRESITPWGNFQDGVCKMCYKHNPNIPVIFSLRRASLLALYFYTGLMPFIPIKESCLELMMPSIIIDNPHMLHRPNKKQIIMLRMFDMLIMKRCVFEHLRKRGIHVYIWVLNNEQEFQRAFELGADGVMTDFPSKLRDFLDKHPEYASRRRDP